ncbi:hypothetical protein SAMN04487906_0282 [Zhouia amylolytica]|uniref:N-acetyltransferase domain-containing protein n=1 Tax=Zhouia amylolytica TaxID=376730 RepID=A0A1I6PGD0_9FLAO|nr:GNAT family N-acetyltransferase [Zhouia amylolytica]MCQ0111468.1 GNAT family N-acetyltransferase [Zhouia amylolytica]SFS39236.1 hypothetical protein SAMN04487906_0282 [Zhouia amylolytica]
MISRKLNIQKITVAPSSDELKKIYTLYEKVFDNTNKDSFLKKLENKKDLLLLLASIDGKPVGFKIGYALKGTVYYSWSGGVIQDYRQRGVAKALASVQENWVRSKGYTRLRTKSMNRFRPMMILNLKNGFDIVDTDEDRNGNLEVIFEKKL